MNLDNITILDFETSGLDPARDRVIEMAAIRCYGGEIVSQFNTFIRFDGVLPPKITERHHIQGSRQRHGRRNGLSHPQPDHRG
jgi:DNA polymerase III subunit epsilon